MSILDPEFVGGVEGGGLWATLIPPVGRRQSPDGTQGAKFPEASIEIFKHLFKAIPAILVI